MLTLLRRINIVIPARLFHKSALMPWLVSLSAALFFAYELMQMHMMNAIGPFLMRDLDIGATAFGYLSATYLFADVLFLLPAGALLDRFSTRKVILSALFLCILGTLGFGLSQTFFQSCAFHFLSGIGNAFCFLSCMMLIARWFPPEKQAFAVGVVVTVGMLGGIIAQYPFSLLVQAFEWRNALLIDAAIGTGILGLVYLFVRDPPHYAWEGAQNLPLKESVWQALKEKQNLYCGLYTGLMNLPLMLLGAIWGGSFLQQCYQMTGPQAALISSMLCFGTIIGSPLFGYLSDRTQERKWWMIQAGWATVGTLVLLFFPFASTPLYFALVFFALGIFTSVQVLGYPVVTESNPPHLTGTAMGVSALIIMGLPMLLSPLSGYLLEYGWTPLIIEGIRYYTLNNYLLSFAVFPLGCLLAIASAHQILTTER